MKSRYNLKQPPRMHIGHKPASRNFSLLIIVDVNTAAIKLELTMIHYGFIYTLNIYNVPCTTNT